jgi:hypothetical protein
VQKGSWAWIVCKGTTTLYVPLRAFDDDVLVLPSGRSLIARLLTMANQLVIEDADLLPCHLARHFKQFALGDLFVTDLTDQARRRGAAVYLIERKQHDDSGKPIVALSGLMPTGAIPRDEAMFHADHL